MPPAKGGAATEEKKPSEQQTLVRIEVERHDKSRPRVRGHSAPALYPLGAPARQHPLGEGTVTRDSTGRLRHVRKRWRRAASPELMKSRDAPGVTGLHPGASRRCGPRSRCMSKERGGETATTMWRRDCGRTWTTWSLLGMSGLARHVRRDRAGGGVRVGVRARRDADAADHPCTRQRPGARPPPGAIQRTERRCILAGGDRGSGHRRLVDRPLLGRRTSRCWSSAAPPSPGSPSVWRAVPAGVNGVPAATGRRRGRQRAMSQMTTMITTRATTACFQ